jgi:hypothetical protein
MKAGEERSEERFFTRIRGFRMTAQRQRRKQSLKQDQKQRQRRPPEQQKQAAATNSNATALLDFEGFFGVGKFVAFAGYPDVHGWE